MSLKVFVCGATGTQGGNVARHLLSHSVPVNFLARDPSSTKAQSIVSLGASLFPGSYDDPNALATAMTGCTGLFLNLMPSFTDMTEELRHANTIIAAAKESGITHAVYSSTLGMYDMPKLPSWDPNGLPAQFFASKLSITKAIQTGPFDSWAIIRPGKFMSDFLKPGMRMFPGLAEQGILTTPLRKHDHLPLTDPDAIGAFGAAALMQPEKFAGQEVDVFCDFLTPEELVSEIARATGREMKVVFVSDEEMEAQKGDLFLEAQKLMRDADRYCDLEKVKAWGVPVGTFGEFLEREKDRVKETYGQVV